MNKSLTKDDFLPGSSKIRLRCAFINVPKKYLHYRKRVNSILKLIQIPMVCTLLYRELIVIMI